MSLPLSIKKRPAEPVSTAPIKLETPLEAMQVYLPLSARVAVMVRTEVMLALSLRFDVMLIRSLVSNG